MRMIPDTVSENASNAERKVFNALRNIARSDSTICLHSLNLPRHTYKTCCELDFVILGPEGLYAIEVKGGGVSRNDKGLWEMVDRNGKMHLHNEGPFKQVQGNFFALLEQLKKFISLPDLKDIPKGWGVVLPDCRFDISTVEWDEATVADQPWMGQLASWLDNLIHYYQKKAGVTAAYRMSPDTLRRIADHLRPSFESPASIAGRIDSAEMVFRTLTDEQCRVVDILKANSRVLCSGGAGTGKTFLAIELAQRMLDDGQSVMICCSSAWLKQSLDVKLVHPNIKILTIKQARRIDTATTTVKVDVLIVDEAQDMMNFEDLDVFDKMLNGGLNSGSWAFFFDSNNQTGLLGHWDPKAFDYLNSFGALHIPLTRNCRNTKQIIEEIVRQTKCTMGAVNQGDGPKVESLLVSDPHEFEKELEKTVSKLLASGVAPSHITILSPLIWAESSVSRLSNRLLQSITPLDEFIMRTFPPKQISFARVHDFKGLENSAIIFTDLDDSVLSQKPPTILYVGMSRARAHLTLILSKHP
jgi:Nuclease-related domain/AAA domain